MVKTREDRLPRDFWEKAKVVMPIEKVMISMRVDADVVAFFKSEGRGYQTRMAAVLRGYVLHKKTTRG